MMQYKDFPLKATNCKAELEVSDEELRAKGMINAKIRINTHQTDFSQDMMIALKPKLETMLFDTCDEQGNQANDFFAIINGDQLVVSPLNKQTKAKGLIIYCKVNN